MTLLILLASAMVTTALGAAAGAAGHAMAHRRTCRDWDDAAWWTGYDARQAEVEARVGGQCDGLCHWASHQAQPGDITTVMPAVWDAPPSERAPDGPARHTVAEATAPAHAGAPRSWRRARPYVGAHRGAGEDPAHQMVTALEARNAW